MTSARLTELVAPEQTVVLRRPDGIAAVVVPGPGAAKVAAAIDRVLLGLDEIVGHRLMILESLGHQRALTPLAKIVVFGL